jgi:hypothetical protein
MNTYWRFDPKEHTLQEIHVESGSVRAHFWMDGDEVYFNPKNSQTQPGPNLLVFKDSQFVRRDQYLAQMADNIARHALVVRLAT